MKKDPRKCKTNKINTCTRKIKVLQNIEYLTLHLNATAVDNLKSCYNILKNTVVAKFIVARTIRQISCEPLGLEQVTNLENNSKFSAFVNSDIVNLACKKLIEL